MKRKPTSTSGINTILLTNDDGPESPLVIPLRVGIQKALQPERVVTTLPDRERSWVSFASTRFEPIWHKPAMIGDSPVVVCNGTPADAVHLSVHHLFRDENVDLIVSGINVGWNAALPFFLSSGTVAGAVAGFLAGIPSVAVSANVPPKVFQLWSDDKQRCKSDFAEDWDRIGDVAAQSVERLLHCNAWSEADLFSLNIPWEATCETSLRVTALSRVGFQKLHIRNADGTFSHSFGGFRTLSTELEREPFPTDASAVSNGEISITPIRFSLTASLSDHLRESLELPLGSAL